MKKYLVGKHWYIGTLFHSQHFVHQLRRTSSVANKWRTWRISHETSFPLGDSTASESMTHTPIREPRIIGNSSNEYSIVPFHPPMNILSVLAVLNFLLSAMMVSSPYLSLFCLWRSWLNDWKNGCIYRKVWTWFQATTALTSHTLQTDLYKAKRELLRCGILLIKSDGRNISLKYIINFMSYSSGPCRQFHVGCNLLKTT